MENPEKDPEVEEREDSPGEEETETGNVTASDSVIKVVINLKGNRATVGVQSIGCDPVFGTAQGNRDEIVQGALKILADAEEKWKTSPRYPKSAVQSAPAAPARTATAPAKAGTKTEGKPTEALF